VDWWGGKSIMLYLTVLLTGLITILGWELGQSKAAAMVEPAPRPRARYITSDLPNHPPSSAEPIPLSPEPTPQLGKTSHTSNTVVYSRSGSSHDSEAIRRLMAELETEFGLEPRRPH